MTVGHRHEPLHLLWTILDSVLHGASVIDSTVSDKEIVLVGLGGPSASHITRHCALSKGLDIEVADP